MTRNQTLTLIAAAILCTNLTGCGTIPSYEDLGNGYVEATYIRTSSWEPTAIRTELRYKKGLGTIVIWPSLAKVRKVVHNDMVVFVGEAALRQLNPGEPYATDSRLFAVKAPELPLDITDEVLWHWSKASGKDFAKALQKFSLVIPEEKNGRLELHLEFLSEGYLSVEKDWPDQSDLQLDWNQVSDILRAVKTKGVVEKDLRWHTPYIGEKF